MRVEGVEEVEFVIRGPREILIYSSTFENFIPGVRLSKRM